MRRAWRRTRPRRRRAAPFRSPPRPSPARRPGRCGGDWQRRSAYETVSVRSQVTGVVTEVLFHEGDFVKKGDHLFTIDPRPYEAMLEQARANLSRDQALVGAGRSAARKRQGQARTTSSSPANGMPSWLERGIVSKDMAQQAQAAIRGERRRRQGRRGRHRERSRRSSARSRPQSTTPRSSSPTRSSDRPSTAGPAT